MRRFAVLFLVLVTSVANLTACSSATGPSVSLNTDIGINGSTNAYVRNGDPFTVAWRISGADNCQMVRPLQKSIGARDSSFVVRPGDTGYPSVGATGTYTVACSARNGGASASAAFSASVLVTP